MVLAVPFELGGVAASIYRREHLERQLRHAVSAVSENLVYRCVGGSSPPGRLATARKRIPRDAHAVSRKRELPTAKQDMALWARCRMRMSGVESILPSEALTLLRSSLPEMAAHIFLLPGYPKPSL